MNSLHISYGYKQSETKPVTHHCIDVQVNNHQFDSTNVHRQLKEGNTDNDIIGMMWEPELDFVDDPESYNECKIKKGPMRYMCGVCLGQYRTR